MKDNVSACNSHLILSTNFILFLICNYFNHMLHTAFLYLSYLSGADVIPGQGPWWQSLIPPRPHIGGRQSKLAEWGNQRDNLRTVGVCVCEREPVKSSIPKNNDRTKKSRSIAGLYILSSWHKWESCHGKECLIGFWFKISLLAAAWNNRKRRPLGKFLDLAELVSILTKWLNKSLFFKLLSLLPAFYIVTQDTHSLYTFTL